MTAPWISQTARWSARAGVGLARSVILLVTGFLYPAMWALLAGWFWLLCSIASHGGAMWSVVELGLFGVVVVLVASRPICRLLRSLVRRWTGITVADGYRPAASIV